MLFLTDECISPTTVKLLRDLGQDVRDIKELHYLGIQDKEVYKIACQQNRMIFTTDKGFRKFNPVKCGGIIISTIQPNSPMRYEPRLKHLLTTTDFQELTGKLVYLEEKRHRIIKMIKQ